MRKITVDLLTPRHWEDYQLIDSGDGEKLERFGQYILARPEPQAIWQRSLPTEVWQQRADAYFRRDLKGSTGGQGDEWGEWLCRPGMPEQWHINYAGEGLALNFRLRLTPFKHVGLFPEQAANWEFIAQQVRRIGAQSAISHVNFPGAPALRVLNLFAYTGGATLAACSAGAEVTHVDAVKAVVNWGRDNLATSGLDGVRWLVDDALKFAHREVKRGKLYQGIILDPPAYGRGPDGERWILEESIGELLSLCGQLLAPSGSFLVLNLYSKGLSALLARTIVHQLVGERSGEQFGELFFEDDFSKALPLGVYYRMWRE